MDYRFLNHVLTTVPLSELASIASYLCGPEPSFPGILYYDYLLTFSREVEYFWPISRPCMNGISVIFFLNRYLAIFGHIPIAMALLPHMECEEVGTTVLSAVI